MQPTAYKSSGKHGTLLTILYADLREQAHVHVLLVVEWSRHLGPGAVLPHTGRSDDTAVDQLWHIACRRDDGPIAPVCVGSVDDGSMARDLTTQASGPWRGDGARGWCARLGRPRSGDGRVARRSRRPGENVCVQVVCGTWDATNDLRTCPRPFGRVVGVLDQLADRLLCMQEVPGSKPGYSILPNHHKLHTS